MNHVMLDVETMGVRTNASIMAIGACYFDPSTGQIGDTFHEQVSIATNGVLDASTVIWWMGQSDEARSKFRCNGTCKDINTVLREFSMFLLPCAQVQVWGNGAAFDNVIIRSAYEYIGCPAPWKHWNDRDVRTVVELGEQMGFDPKRSMPFEGVKHDALADAIHQARYVSAIWQRLFMPSPQRGVL